MLNKNKYLFKTAKEVGVESFGKFNNCDIKFYIMDKQLSKLQTEKI